MSQQYYDEEAQQFLADRYITGTCPHCGNERAYGDQCEACGTSLNATDLINPKSALSGSKPVLKETKHWFLPLDHLKICGSATFHRGSDRSRRPANMQNCWRLSFGIRKTCYPG